MFESFDPKTAIDWGKQIEKELKGKSMDNLIFNDYSGIEIRPFYHSDRYLNTSELQKNTVGWKPVVGIFMNKDNLLLSEKIVHFSKDQGISKFCFWTTNLDDPLLLKFIADLKSEFPDIKLFEPKDVTSKTSINKYTDRSGCHEYIDTLCINEIGASALTELLYGILAIKKLTTENTKLSISWVMGIGKNYFTEIAKFRAARIITQKLFQGVTLSLHGVTGLHYRTYNDLHNNLLRSVTAAMSAIIGGCDELTIHPLDIHIQESTLESYRWANNIHHILKHESHFDKIPDPVKGSHFLEYLTEQLTVKALEVFLQTIDDPYSMLNDKKNQEIQERISNLQNNNEVMININKHVGNPPLKSNKRSNLYSALWKIQYDEDVVLGSDEQ